MEPTHLFLKLKDPEATIRDPRSRTKLPAEGKRVPNSEFWRARLRDGDVVKVETPKQAVKAKKDA